jgi:dihydroorotate dehydrogenase (NAD+) catalytic subunit
MVGSRNDETLGRYWSETPERGYAAVRAVKDVVGIPVWAKFPFETVYRDQNIVLKMEEAGADAAVVMTTMPRAMAINIRTGRPLLGNPKGAGAVGGPTMKPLGIHCVSEVSRILRIPVIATGGVFSGLDVVEYAMVGACGIEVLTAVMKKRAVQAMLAELRSFMSKNKYDSYQAFRGKALGFLPPPA